MPSLLYLGGLWKTAMKMHFFPVVHPNSRHSRLMRQEATHRRVVIEGGGGNHAYAERVRVETPL